MSGTAPGTATALLPQRAVPVSGTALLPPIEGEQCRAGTASLWGVGERCRPALTEATDAIRSSTGAITIYRRHNKPALGPVGDSLGDLAKRGTGVGLQRRRLLWAEGVLELRRQRIVLGDAARPPRAVARRAVRVR